MKRENENSKVYIVNCDCDQVVYIFHEDVVKVEKRSTVSKGIKESSGG